MFKLNKVNFKLLFSVCLLASLYFVATERAAAFAQVDYDGKADFSVFRPSDRTWYSYSSEAESYNGFQWGLASDVLAPADYDGDGLTDFTVWRPETGVWYTHRTRDNKLFAVQWGKTTAFEYGLIPDVPVPADYDGDGLDDFAVWRPETGVWYILQSSAGYNSIYAESYQWGKLGDIPVQADYDGDGKADVAVFRSTQNRWYILQSSNNKVVSVDFGQSGDDLLVPDDYTGDGKADLAVYRNGNWIIRRSDDNKTEVQQFGLRGDKPVPADYDGDGKTDLAVYRNGIWYILDSSTKQFHAFNYGLASDIPLSSANVKQSIVALP